MEYYSAKEIATGKECLVAKCDFDELPKDKAKESLLAIGIEVNTDKIVVRESSHIFDKMDCWDAIGGDWEG